MNTNSTIKTFFVNNWLTLVLIVVVGIGAYIGINYLTNLNNKNEQIQALVDAQKQTLADRERDITALTESYGKQQAQLDSIRVEYDTKIQEIQTNLDTQISALRRARTQRVQTLTSNPSELTSEFARRFGLTQNE